MEDVYFSVGIIDYTLKDKRIIDFLGAVFCIHSLFYEGMEEKNLFNFSLRKLFVFILLGLSVLSLTVVVVGQSVFGQPELVDDIRVGAGSSNPIDLTAIDGVLYFRANDGVLGEDFWVFESGFGKRPDVDE